MQLTLDGGVAPVESPDGQHIYYTKDRSYPTSIWKVSVNGAKEQQIVEQSGQWRHFYPAENGIYFGLFQEIRFLSFATGKTKTVANLEGSMNLGITVSPDRRYLLYGQIDHGGTDLFLVDNFE